MKLIALMVLAMVLMISPVYSQTIHKQAVLMKWEQPIFDTLQGWKFYGSRTSGGGGATGFVEFFTKTYSELEGIVGTPNPLYPELVTKTFTQAIDIPDSLVIKGQLQRVYFKATAIRTGGIETGFSNEGYIDLDLRPVPIPVIKCESVK